MKVKEINRTANLAWSPQPQHPIYMVAGTAAQQLDATFSTNAALEVYNLNLGDPSLDMPLVASIPSESRFHKVAWGCHGVADMAQGVIMGGVDNGELLAYDAGKLLAGEKDCLLFKKSKHTGTVKAMDFNPFQSNLLVSGGGDSEIFIWDLNNPDNPMTPGAKSHPPEDVACLSWNRQVQHILASTFAARCVVWDLRKNEPIIKVSDSMSRIKSKLVCWNPSVATQMCLSSEDDHTPVIQLWDLRYATSPVKVLESHQRGILSMAWCPQDPDLLLSCAKDNRILCWNPNSAVQTGEVVYELPTSHQWSFDVQWCPRNPNIISSSSFDGSITCFSLMGGGHPIHQGDRVADSFQSNDPFAQTIQTQPQEQNVMPLQKPPRWLQRPAGANFGFGGKLVSFENTKPTNPQQPVSRQIMMSQVVTETDLLTGSLQLEQALSNGQHREFCAMKAANTSDTMQESIWNFLMVNFEKEPRERYIQLLGYDKTELATKVSRHTAEDNLSDSVGPGVNADELAKKMNQLGTGDASSQQQELASSGQASPSVGSKTPGSRDELNFTNGDSSAFDDISFNQVQPTVKIDTPMALPTEDDADGLLCQALLTGNFEAAVDMCLSENKMAEAILLSIAGGPELLSRTQKRYFQKSSSSIGRLISAVVTHDWSHIVRTCELENWKEALAIILTYSPTEEFASLCDVLAVRLETEGNGELSSYAGLCYICSGNVEKMVENWITNTKHTESPQALQDLVEKVMLLRKAVEQSRGQRPDVGSGQLAEKLSMYAGILAAQGCLDTALVYLGDSSEVKLGVLKDRLYHALGQAPNGVPVPQCPWQRVSVQPTKAAAASQQSITYPLAAMQHQKPISHMANSNFNTSTTDAFSSQNKYYNQYSNMNAPNVPTYNPTNIQNPVSSAATPRAASKGPLANKYPTYQQNDGAYPNTYNPAGYNQPQPQPITQENYYSGNYMTPTSQPSAPNTGAYPNSTPGGPYAPNSMGSNHPSLTSYQDHKPISAWNDPPMVVRKEKSTPQAPSDVAPITNPIYGTQGQQGMGDQGPPGAPYGNLYNPQEYQPEPQTFNSIAPQAAYTQAPYTHAEPKPKPVAPEPVKEVVKPPVPAEHKVLQDIFDGLVHNCQARASNAQMKRKLDDVSRKLEALYDRLRENSLSPSVIQGLHQIVQSVQQYDYNSGLGFYTQMVSQGNFSEISSFMPGLKMLMQSATQLQVYVQ